MQPIRPSQTAFSGTLPHIPAAGPTRFGHVSHRSAPDSVRFGSDEKPENETQKEENGKPIGQRLLDGGKEALKATFNPSGLLMDTLWAGLFFGISALLTAGPGGLIAAPFIPVIIATSASIRGIFGFMRGFSGNGRIRE